MTWLDLLMVHDFPPDTETTLGLSTGVNADGMVTVMQPSGLLLPVLVLVAVSMKVFVLDAVTLVGEMVKVQTWASVNVVCATNPEACPVAVSVYVTPTSSRSGAYSISVKVPSAPATAEAVSSSSSVVDFSCSTIDTVSPGSQPLPVMVTFSPGV